MAKKKKVLLPPQLPPDIADEEIEVSDDDIQFVKTHRDFAGFLKKLDTSSINKQVSRVANKKEENQKEDALESSYEEKLRKKSLEKSKEEKGLEVDPVDALPVKTLDGKLYYRTAEKKSKEIEENEGDKEDGAHESLVKRTKAEKRAKVKKSRKEAKKLSNEPVKEEPEQVTDNPQAQVLAEVKEDLSAEEIFIRKKSKLAELGVALLADPESNIKSLKEILELCNDGDHNVVKLGLLSLLAVFKDIIPGYRIRLPTEKELEMTVSKAVKKMRYYESTLLSSYKVYLQRLISLEKLLSFHVVSVRCMCTLLEAVPHFNFRENLLAAVVRNISSPEDVIRKSCCAAIKSLFTNEGKHGGEVTVEAVQLIADHVKIHDCRLHPDSVEVFLSLTFSEDIRRSESSKDDAKGKRGGKKRWKHSDEQNKLPASDKKRSRQELLAKTREEVNSDLKATSFTPDALEKRRMQTETLFAVFETYFRILKHTMRPAPVSPTVNTSPVIGRFGAHPLLAPCLNGLGKFAHLIDVDYMGDLMNSLKVLSCGGSNQESSAEIRLTVSERLRCCIVAFKVMRNNLDALNVDLQEFFVQLYNLLLEYRPDRDQGEVLAEALKIMLCEGRQHDMQRAAAFIKRLATSSLCFGSAEAMAALITLKDLLQKNAKCRNLLENDAGGGSLSGSVAKYQPYASDPNQSGALASVLWELSLLCKHYQPSVSAAASSILTVASSNPVYLSTTSPLQAFVDLSIEQESFKPKTNGGASKKKRKHSSMSSKSSTNESSQYNGDEEDVSKRLSEHFMVLKDITENERLRKDLNHTVSSIRLYEEYKKQKKRKQGGSKAKGARKKGKIVSFVSGFQRSLEQSRYFWTPRAVRIFLDSSAQNKRKSIQKGIGKGLLIFRIQKGIGKRDFQDIYRSSPGDKIREFLLIDSRKEITLRLEAFLSSQVFSGTAVREG